MDQKLTRHIMQARQTQESKFRHAMEQQLFEHARLDALADGGCGEPIAKRGEQGPLGLQQLAGAPRVIHDHRGSRNAQPLVCAEGLFDVGVSAYTVRERNRIFEGLTRALAEVWG